MDLQPGMKLRHARTVIARRQRGAVMIIFAIGMLAILAMTGLAIDGSHMLLNKTRLQNMVDSSALAGARVINNANNLAAARQTAQQMLIDNANAAGNREFALALGGFAAGGPNQCGVQADGNVHVCVQFSSTYPDFDPASWDPTPGALNYVRVAVSGYTLPNYFVQVLSLFGYDPQKTISASAIAGPSPPLDSEGADSPTCNMVPIIMCGNKAAGEDNDWGFPTDRLFTMKYGPIQGGCTAPAGHGNFQLADIQGGGAAAVRDQLAGGTECVDLGGFVDTKTGNVASIRDALNTRFGDYRGAFNDPAAYPADVNTNEPDPPMEYVENDKKDCSDDEIHQGNDNPVAYPGDIDFNHTNYTSQNQGGFPNPNGVEGRRYLRTIVADCTVDHGSGGAGHGKQNFEVLGAACMFLSQRLPQSGGESFIFGEFLESCGAAGNPGNTDPSGSGLYRIQLYHDFSSFDS